MPSKFAVDPGVELQPSAESPEQQEKITWNGLHAPSALGPWAVALAVAILVGTAARLMWLSDMTYLYDHAYFYYHGTHLGRPEPWSWVSLQSGVGAQTPALSVWVLALLARITGATEPTELARDVALLGVGSIVLLLWLALRIVPRAEREPWLWATALAAVSPFAVLMERKIWNPSLVPFFAVLALIGYFRRERAWGAFLWGLVGACLGQFHMGGFFFSFALVLWTAVFARPSVRWRAWFVGSVIGAIPLVGWFHHWASVQGGQAANGFLAPRFWLYWLTDAIGVEIIRPATLVEAIAPAICVLAFLGLAGRAGRAAWRARAVRPIFIGPSSTAIASSAAFWGFGILLALPTFMVWRHYLFVAFPFAFVWIARIGLAGDAPRPGARRWGRILLAVLCVGQAATTLQILTRIHLTGFKAEPDPGAGEEPLEEPYGPAYRLQAEHADVITLRSLDTEELVQQYLSLDRSEPVGWWLDMAYNLAREPAELRRRIAAIDALPPLPPGPAPVAKIP